MVEEEVLIRGQEGGGGVLGGTPVLCLGRAPSRGVLAPLFDADGQCSWFIHVWGRFPARCLPVSFCCLSQVLPAGLCNGVHGVWGHRHVPLRRVHLVQAACTTRVLLAVPCAAAHSRHRCVRAADGHVGRGATASLYFLVCCSCCRADRLTSLYVSERGWVWGMGEGWVGDGWVMGERRQGCARQSHGVSDGGQRPRVTCRQ